jgi:uncharacterized protein YkwD
VLVPRRLGCGSLRRTGLVLVATVVCASATTTGRALAGDPCASAAIAQRSLLSDELAAACAINGERTARGLRPLRWDPALADAARRYSDEMVAGRFFSHISPSGGRLWARVAATGYLCGAARWRLGEMLAWGTGWRAAPPAVVAAWLASAPHRDILLRPGYRDVGVGVAAGDPLAGDASVDGLTYSAELGTRPGSSASGVRTGKTCLRRERRRWRRSPTFG